MVLVGPMSRFDAAGSIGEQGLCTIDLVQD